MTMIDLTTWVPVLPLDQLPTDRGVCALIGPWQVALFRTGFDGEIHALSNLDPFSRAYVLSRGIVGTRGEVPTVASPVYKQRFDLRTGQCLDDEAVVVATVPVRVEGDVVQVRLS